MGSTRPIVTSNTARARATTRARSPASRAKCDLTAPADVPVSAVLEDLTPGTTYHYRLVSNNANGVTTPGPDQTFKPLGPPFISNETVSKVNTDNATLGTRNRPQGPGDDLSLRDRNRHELRPRPAGTGRRAGLGLRHRKGVADSRQHRIHQAQTRHHLSLPRRRDKRTGNDQRPGSHLPHLPERGRDHRRLSQRP